VSATATMPRRLHWEHDGRDWPHHAASRFVHAGGLRWHVQQHASTRADAPRLLLLHGTGASTHSWRALVEPLATHFDVLALDLPGHGFTSMPDDPSRLGLAGMASATAALLDTMQWRPDMIVGHSAGAAVGVRMALDAPQGLRALVGINAALLPLHGLAGSLFSPLARLLAALPGVPTWFARRAADPAVLARLLDATGSRLDAHGRDLYATLVANPGHVAGALGMMARWDLQTFAAELPRLAVPLHLLVGTADGTVPPDQAWQVAERVPHIHVTRLPGLGHLAHEERPRQVAEMLIAIDTARLSQEPPC
jgi:magnesium chelatase accessory protein